MHGYTYNFPLQFRFHLNSRQEGCHYRLPDRNEFAALRKTNTSPGIHRTKTLPDGFYNCCLLQVRCKRHQADQTTNTKYKEDMRIQVFAEYAKLLLGIKHLKY